MNSKELQGKVAVVTGAGQGIGYEICRQLALRGASVLLNDLDEELAVSAVAKIRAEGGICQSFAGDISKFDCIQNMVADAVCHFGGVDIAIANAGITLFGEFFTYSPESFQKVIQVNLAGSFFLTQVAAAQMRKQGRGGRIVLMSSVTGHQAYKDFAAYGMTKGALEVLARDLVLDLSPLGITINTVAPGATLTERTMTDPNYGALWSKLTPTGRASTPHDIAEAVLFLVSPRAPQVTGQTLIVDGGWTCTSPDHA